MTILVNCRLRTIVIGGATFDCEIGRNGPIAASEKREGDGRTPVGDWPIRGAILRPDRGFDPPPHLPWRWCLPQDGWSDDVGRPDYNRPVQRPYPGSSEELWRPDPLYDVIIVLGYNDDPPCTGLGSAIFLHLRSTGPTEGCIAIDAEAMKVALQFASYDERLRVQDREAPDENHL